jgi:hypothetical protein
MLRNPKYKQQLIDMNKDILNDVQNPELEGRIMLFYFGHRISQIISLEKNKYEHSFNLITKPINVQDFVLLSYDNCYFSDKKYYMEDMDLNLDDKMRYKRIDYNNLDRMLKLQKILVKMK